MKRIPEPELMDSETQTTAYADADFSEPNQIVVDSVLAEFRDLPDSGDAADLGCGPAQITVLLAQALPDWLFWGIDGGENMLALAQEEIDQASLDHRVRLLHTLLPDEALGSERFDLIISNSLLHHLPDPDSLWQSVRQLARPGARVLVMDLLRPDTPEMAQAIVDLHAADEAEVLREDFFNSLCAAYTEEEIQRQLENNQLDFLQLQTPTDRHWLVSGRIPET